MTKTRQDNILNYINHGYFKKDSPYRLGNCVYFAKKLLMNIGYTIKAIKEHGRSI